MYAYCTLYLQPIPRAKSGNLDSNCISLESNLIWDQDMQETIKDISFREKIAKFFKKTPASKCKLYVPT